MRGFDSRSHFFPPAHVGFYCFSQPKEPRAARWFTFSLPPSTFVAAAKQKRILRLWDFFCPLPLLLPRPKEPQTREKQCTHTQVSSQAPLVAPGPTSLPACLKAFLSLFILHLKRSRSLVIKDDGDDRSERRRRRQKRRRRRQKRRRRRRQKRRRAAAEAATATTEATTAAADTTAHNDSDDRSGDGFLLLRFLSGFKKP